MHRIEFVNTGMLHAGEIRRAGEICDMSDELYQTPEEQYEETKRVFYIEVGSVYDTPFMKKKLFEGTNDIFSTADQLLSPEFSEEVEEMFGFEKFDGDESLENLLGENAPIPIEPIVEEPEEEPVNEPEPEPEPEPVKKKRAPRKKKKEPVPEPVEEVAPVENVEEVPEPAPVKKKRAPRRKAAKK